MAQARPISSFHPARLTTTDPRTELCDPGWPTESRPRTFIEGFGKRSSLCRKITDSKVDGIREPGVLRDWASLREGTTQGKPKDREKRQKSNTSIIQGLPLEYPDTGARKLTSLSLVLVRLQPLRDASLLGVTEGAPPQDQETPAILSPRSPWAPNPTGGVCPPI